MKKLAFYIASAAVGTATAGIFWLVLFMKRISIYENILLILWVEIFLSTSYAIWAFTVLKRKFDEKMKR